MMKKRNNHMAGKLANITIVTCGAVLLAGCTGLAGAALSGGMFLADRELDKAKEKRELADEKMRYLAREHAKWQMDRVQLERMKQELGMDGVIMSDLNRRLISGELTRIIAIKAKSANGVVTLTGNVPSEKVKERAIRIASSIPGVRQVIPNLNVIEVKIQSPESLSRTEEKPIGGDMPTPSPKRRVAPPPVDLNDQTTSDRYILDD